MSHSIRQVTVRNEKCWCLDRVEAGKRKRSFFPTKAEAEAAGAHLRANGDDNRSAFLALEPSVREQIMAAALAGLEQGHTVASIAAAITAKPVPSTKQAGEALEAFLARLKGEQRSTEYIASVRQWLGHLIRGRTTVPLSDITKDVVVAWLGERQGWTRATMRSRARAWFNWCIMEGWITTDPTEKIPAARIINKPVSILTPEQHETCLRHLEANPRGLAWYVLSCVSGLRPGEAEQMTWENVVLDTEEPVLRVDAVTSKTGSRRAVYLDAQTVIWLERAKALKSSLPLPWSTRRRVHRKLRDLFKWAAWPQDITRHSASSYRLALHRNPHLIAEDLGHSVKTMNRHYKAVVTKEAARAFFGVMPAGTPKNTVAVDFKATSGDHPTTPPAICPTIQGAKTN